MIGAIGGGGGLIYLLSQGKQFSHCSDNKYPNNIIINNNNNQKNSSDFMTLFNPSKDIYKIKKGSNLTLYFDCKTRNPRYVIEHLQSKDISLASSPGNKRPHFYIENIIDSDFMVQFVTNALRTSFILYPYTNFLSNK